MRKCLVQCLEASVCSISAVIIVQSLSCIWLLETPWTAACQASLSFTISWSLLKPGACPLSQWCHPTISPSVVPFSSCLQSFPGWGSFPMSHLSASRGQSIGASSSASVPPVNIQHWFPLILTGLISLQSKWLSRVFSNITVQKHHSLVLSFMVQFSHPYMTTGKTIALTKRTFVGKVISLLFNMLSRLFIAFLPRSKCLLISWLQSPSAGI